MPHHKRSHSENRKVVCLLCFKKPKSQLRNISDHIKLLFNKLILSDPSNKIDTHSISWLPSVICTGCINMIKRHDNNISMPLKHIDYSSLTPPQQLRGEVVTRSSWEPECLCSVCTVGRMKGTGNEYQTYKQNVSDLPGWSSVEVIILASICA